MSYYRRPLSGYYGRPLSGLGCGCPLPASGLGELSVLGKFWEGLKDDLSFITGIGYTPPAIGPVRQLPTAPAPQTAPKLKTWGSEDFDEAGAQKNQQYSSDSDWIANLALRPNAGPLTFTSPSQPTDLWLWIGLAAGAVYLLSRK